MALKQSSIKKGEKIIEILPGSPADEAGIKVGDRLLRINGLPMRDVLDFQFACLDDVLIFELMRRDRTIKANVRQSPVRSLGIKFASSVFDSLKICANRCRFCFIDQLPPALRPSLYIKDDDFRLSFLYGNFITLTNLSSAHIERIIVQRLTPLYVSLHSTDPIIRRGLIQPKSKDRSLDFLKKLVSGGIEVHIQIVLCPGINDGLELYKTVNVLSELGVASIGIVPVGLTAYRDNLNEIRPVSSDGAVKLIKQITSSQKSLREQTGSRLVFLADEFYLLARKPFPADSEYEDYPQLENGIGLARLFLTEIAASLKGSTKPKIRQNRFTILTSTLAAPVLNEAAQMITSSWGIGFNVVVAKNDFFGGGVSVTGLLAGIDIIREARKLTPEDAPLLIPDICLNTDKILLDDLTVDHLKHALSLRTEFVPSTGQSFLSRLAKLAS